MTRYLSTFLATTFAVSAAQAHPGHVADAGFGHSHWLALAILGGLGLAVAAFALVRTARSRGREGRQA